MTPTSIARGLLASMRNIGPQRFVTLVLQRYDWNLPVAQGTSMDVLVQQVMERRRLEHGHARRPRSSC